MNKSHAYLLAALLAAASPLAFANHDGMGAHCKMHTKVSFEEADADKDGTLDQEEAKRVCNRNFDEMDADHDGTVSKEELNACGRGKLDKKAQARHDKGSKKFTAADADNDGTLTKEEAKKLPRVSKNFDAIDTDKDGTLDRNEVHEFMHKKSGK